MPVPTKVDRDAGEGRRHFRLGSPGRPDCKRHQQKSPPRPVVVSRVGHDRSRRLSLRRGNRRKGSRDKFLDLEQTHGDRVLAAVNRAVIDHQTVFPPSKAGRPFFPLCLEAEPATDTGVCGIAIQQDEPVPNERPSVALLGFPQQHERAVSGPRAQHRVGKSICDHRQPAEICQREILADLTRPDVAARHRNATRQWLDVEEQIGPRQIAGRFWNEWDPGQASHIRHDRAPGSPDRGYRKPIWRIPP